MKHSWALHGMSLGDSCRQEVSKRMWNAKSDVKTEEIDGLSTGMVE